MIIQKNISLKQFNTFQVDAFAKYFCQINDLNELNSLIMKEQFRGENKFILGGGSNVLFTKDFEGIVVKNNISGISIISENADLVLLEVGAGYDWDKLVEYTVAAGFNGLENLSLIPGTVGASPIQNIGAYGVEVKDLIESVKGISLEDNKFKTLSNSECNFGYRNSIFKTELKGGFIVTSVVFNLSKSQNVNTEYAALQNYISEHELSIVTPTVIRQAVIKIRRSKLPDPQEFSNAGSFFKNPVISKNVFKKIKSKYPDLNGYRDDDSSVKISAGWLIEKCGLKGRRVKDVGIYEKQALVIINYGNATGCEIFEFSEQINLEVYNQFNIELVKEVNIV